MDLIPNVEDFVRNCVSRGLTHEEISRQLQLAYPLVNRGFSSRSVRRFCNTNGITRYTRLNDQEVDTAVERAVSEVGPSYGRRTLLGYVRSQGLQISERRIRPSIRRVTPLYVQNRYNCTYRLINPTPYYAQYFGHKLHMDQNEKMIRYGVTHVAASDGYSGKIVKIITMPIKNPIMIYEHLYRPIVLMHGMWDQVRVDCGTEFALMLFVQRLLSMYRTNTTRNPYVQTRSTQNHTAERHWVEINSRVNYPLKHALVNLEEQGLIDMDCEITKYCVSLMARQISQVGIQRHVQSWNHHRIPGPNRGIPNIMARQNNHAATIDPSVVPDTLAGVSLYEREGGHLTMPSVYGRDPLSDSPGLLAQRKALMESNLPSPEQLFSWTVNGSYQPFGDSLKYMIDVTNRLNRLI